MSNDLFGMKEVFNDNNLKLNRFRAELLVDLSKKMNKGESFHLNKIIHKKDEELIWKSKDEIIMVAIKDGKGVWHHFIKEDV